MRKIITIAFVGAIIWIGINFYNSEQKGKSTAIQEKETLPEIGFKVPDIKLKGFNGDTHSLNDAKGKPYIINFWASWCKPCEIEAPDLVHLYEKYKGEIEIFAVNAADSDTVSNATAFTNRFGFEFPILLDGDGAARMDYKVYLMPTTFFVDRNGVIVDKVRGVLPSDQLENKFKKLIEK
ncbi:TlpA family protein disulfide reductase [Bacillus cereus]|uniref:TlpA family protein disulfide reductase n=1 Tax=Bacillus cereus TaxID=1396 RepID=UPI000BF3EA6D|nr:TlpA disulfide reductase family protein [Bacillus cereus]PFA86227.1 thiol-disulfide reductase [Bacillus cereus]